MFTVRRLILFAFCLMLCGCASVRQHEIRDAYVIPGVPFFSQEDYQCGPASLAGVLNFWGDRATPGEIAADIFSRSARGTLTIDMLIYAQKRGFNARQYRGSFDDLKGRLREGWPVVVLVDYGILSAQVNHFMVVIGYNDEGVIANSGKAEKTFISNERFLGIWGRANYWTLVITPK